MQARFHFIYLNVVNSEIAALHETKQPKRFKRFYIDGAINLNENEKKVFDFSLPPSVGFRLKSGFFRKKTVKMKHFDYSLRTNLIT